MGPVTGFVAFALIWWMVFFAVLPFGVRSQWEGEGAKNGTDPGAPETPGMRRKLLITTGIAAVFWLLFIAIMMSGLVTIDSLPAPFDIPEL